MSTGGNDARVNLIDVLTNFRSRARGYLLDMLNGMLFVTRVDSFRRVTSIEINIHLQARDLLHNRNTLILRYTRINSGFVNHHITLADHLTNGARSTYQRSEVGIVVCINWSRNGNNVEVAILDFLNIASADETVVLDGILKDVICYFKSSIMTSHQGVTTLLVHVKTHSWVLG